MLRGIVLLMSLVVVGGCSVQGQLSTAQEVEDPATACNVYLIRKSSLMRASVTYTVGVDHQDMLKLSCGHYTKLQVDSGSHLLNVKYHRAAYLGTAEKTLSFECKPKDNVYLLITTGSAPSMKVLSEQEGVQYIQKYKYVELQ